MTSQEAFRQDRRGPRTARRRVVSRRGELLLYRSRTPLPETSSATLTLERPVVIVHGGREFSATPEMAECFLARARRVLDAGEAHMVALLHADGLDLLFVAENIPFSVGNTFTHQPR